MPKKERITNIKGIMVKAEIIGLKNNTLFIITIDLKFYVVVIKNIFLTK